MTFLSICFQMMVVFLPTLMMQVFTIYFVIKSLTLRLSIDFWMYFDFAVWNSSLLIPTVFAIYSGAVTMSRSQKLCNYVGKYLNFNTDIDTLQRVKLTTIFLRLLESFIKKLVIDKHFVQQIAQSSNCFIVWTLQH